MKYPFRGTFIVINKGTGYNYYMPFPSAIDSPDVSMQGTTLFTADSHASQHRTIGSAVIAIEQFLGTNAATDVFNGFQSGWFPLALNGGTPKIVLSHGTYNQSILGSPTITGGTFNNQTFGTPTLQAPTISGQGTNSGTIINGVYNSATIGSTSILQPLNSAFWALPNVAGTSAQILGTNQLTQILFGVVSYDLLNEFGTANNNFIAKQAGLYQFGLQTELLGVATGVELGIRLNGTFQQFTQTNPSISAPLNIMWQGSVPLGGTVDCAAFNNSSSNPGTINSSQVITSFYGKRVF